MAGEEVSWLVTTASGEQEVTFVVGSADDVTTPTLTTAALLDDAGGTLVIGVEGNDDVGLAGFVARDIDGAQDIVSAASPDHVLVVEDVACVDVRALDLAGLESAPVRVCAGEGEGEGEGEPPRGGCFGGAPAMLLMFPVLRRRRSRR